MAETTVIRGAAWIIAWDPKRASHCYRCGEDLAFQGNTIIHIGPGYDGPAEREVDGHGLMVMPGLINVHSHPLSEPMGKGYGEDVGNPRLGMSGLYDYMPAYGPDEAGYSACAQVAYVELLKSGVTTLVDLSVPYPDWLEVFSASGLRGCLAPMFRSARWYTDNGHDVRYEWSEDGGKDSFANALELVDQALNHESGRLSAMVCPAQVDTCTAALLRDAQAAARERKIPLQIHAAQSIVEFREMTRRHGVTALEWLRGLEIMAPDTIVAHAIFIDSHSWVNWHIQNDFNILRDSGVAVAHCPNVFLRHGMVLESFGRYRGAGIEMGIGTDTFPHNMLEEMRYASLLSRVPQRNLENNSTADVFEAATLGGARLLGREDIGRLVVGAKADLVLVDVTHPSMRPLRDPLRSLVVTAADRAVRDVYVDGQRVVADGRVLTLDYSAAVQAMEAARDAAEAKVPERDWAGRDLDTLSPLSFPVNEC